MAWEQPTSRLPEYYGSSSREGIRSGFMSRVYAWMFTGLLLTAGVAFFVATDADKVRWVAKNWWMLMIVQLGLVVALSFLQARLQPWMAGAMFVAYAALNGVVLSGIFWVYHLGSIAQVFLLAAGMFGGMSIYGAITKKDLTAWSSFLMMGLLGLVGASLANLFFQSEGLSFVTSCAGVLVFTGLTAYDTQKLRAMEADAVAGSGTMAINGALMLYLDFINLFLSLLRLMGRRR